MAIYDHSRRYGIGAAQNAAIIAGMETDYLHPHDVANLLQVPRRRVKRMADAGLLPAIILPNGEYRFPRAVLLEVVAGWRKRPEGANR
jgi:hypothetical protein